MARFIHKYVLCSKCKLPEITHTVDKKNLNGTCRSCGFQKSLDVMHKAGKTLKNDISSYYAANPEFGSKPTIEVADESTQDAKPRKGKGKKSKKQAV